MRSFDECIQPLCPELMHSSSEDYTACGAPPLLDHSPHVRESLRRIYGYTLALSVLMLNCGAWMCEISGCTFPLITLKNMKKKNFVNTVLTDLCGHI